MILIYLLAFFLVYSIVYNAAIEKRGQIIHLLIIPINLALWVILTPVLLNYLGIQSPGFIEFASGLYSGFFDYLWLVVGFALGAMVADQILHWILFGRGESQYTILASMSGLLLDEVIMRFLLLGILLQLGLSVPVAIFLQAVSYMLYYIDPLSSNRRVNANLNLMHGIIIGTVTIIYGWVFGLALVYVRNFYWMISNKFTGGATEESIEAEKL
ncbi:hypothetical protein KY330_04115 [Candidatus Woesearchaeota archaeon]|nr:hypothetical protein [Candidatus Woesearchaeota archaeon]